MLEVHVPGLFEVVLADVGRVFFAVDQRDEAAGRERGFFLLAEGEKAAGLGEEAGGVSGAYEHDALGLPVLQVDAAARVGVFADEVEAGDDQLGGLGLELEELQEDRGREDVFARGQVLRDSLLP